MNKRNAKPAKVKDAVFTYNSTCCSEAATKPPCVTDKELRKAGKPSEATLGHWRCSVCKKSCKVTRSLRKAEVQEVSQEAA